MLLAQQGIIPDPEQRRQRISGGAAALAAAVNGRIPEDPVLLAEVAGLVERPTPLRGRFSERYQGPGVKRAPVTAANPTIARNAMKSIYPVIGKPSAIGPRRRPALRHPNSRRLGHGIGGLGRVAFYQRDEEAISFMPCRGQQQRRIAAIG